MTDAAAELADLPPAQRRIHLTRIGDLSEIARIFGTAAIRPTQPEQQPAGNPARAHPISRLPKENSPCIRSPNPPSCILAPRSC